MASRSDPTRWVAEAATATSSRATALLPGSEAASTVIHASEWGCPFLPSAPRTRVWSPFPSISVCRMQAVCGPHAAGQLKNAIWLLAGRATGPGTACGVHTGREWRCGELPIRPRPRRGCLSGAVTQGCGRVTEAVPGCRQGTCDCHRVAEASALSRRGGWSRLPVSCLSNLACVRLLAMSPVCWCPGSLPGTRLLLRRLSRVHGSVRSGRGAPSAPWLVPSAQHSPVWCQLSACTTSLEFGRGVPQLDRVPAGSQAGQRALGRGGCETPGRLQ